MTAREPADPTRPADLIRDEAELLAAGMDLQQRSIALLLAEMHALAAMLPGDAQEPKTDAEVEAGFDNMPV